MSPAVVVKDSIFGRRLVISNCNSCHTVIYIIYAMSVAKPVPLLPEQVAVMA